MKRVIFFIGFLLVGCSTKYNYVARGDQISNLSGKSLDTQYEHFVDQQGEKLYIIRKEDFKPTVQCPNDPYSAYYGEGVFLSRYHEGKIYILRNYAFDCKD